MSFAGLSDGYAQGRFDRMAEDVAITRSKVESMEKGLAVIHERHDAHEARLSRLERKLFALWLVGPLLLGAAAAMGNMRAWLLGR